MSASIITNRAAITALQTLQSISSQLDTTQNRVATGLRINEAADNVAYWAISSGLRSDKAIIGAIQDAMQVGQSRVTQAYVAVEQIKHELIEIKNAVVQSTGVSLAEQKKNAAAVATHIENIKNAIKNATIDGTNLLTNGRAKDAPKVMDDKKDDHKNNPDPKPTPSEADSKFVIPTSFRREGDSVFVDRITLDDKVLHFADTKDGSTFQYDKGNLSSILGLDKDGNAFFSIAGKKGQDGKVTEEKPLSADDIAKDASIVEKALNIVGDAETALGAVKNQLGSQVTFVGRLMDNLDKSIGALVDADMNAESTKLSALQVQQQLATQALGIANQSSQGILSLFRR